jgi:DNA-directed RNA polymerase subunit RPC12/RpoP
MPNLPEDSARRPDEEMPDLNAKAKNLGCKDCGANLTYSPGTTFLKCHYCGAENEIVAEEEVIIEEYDFNKALQHTANKADMQTLQTVQCDGCGARSTLKPNIVSDECAFCGTPLVTSSPETIEVFQPKSLLPFAIDHKAADKLFKDWVASLWFVPNDLKKRAELTEKLKGMYIPYWTFDSETDSRYHGMRGDHYYTTENYTDSDGNSKTREVQHTRWTNVSGHIDHFFDDTLVLASHSLPQNYVEKLEPWDLEKLAGYDERYLSGFQTETYQIDLKGGFEIAKGKMDQQIQTMVSSDIGGDEQRIERVQTNHKEITFKHILLPLWISAYRYNDKVFRFLVNARTGEVQGERPYSTIKIVLAVMAVLAIIILFFVLTSGKKRSDLFNPNDFGNLASNFDSFNHLFQTTFQTIYLKADLLSQFVMNIDFLNWF